MNKKTTVALIYGGRGYESEVSLRGAENIRPIIEKNYRCLSVFIDKDGKWLFDGKEVLLRVATPNAKAYIMNNNSGNWYDVKNKGSRVGFAATVAAGGNCTLKVEIIPQM
jgi:D-alanine-D-alanine ligase-like ATP-grasp enzyme